jgi:hypothetical protein
VCFSEWLQAACHTGTCSPPPTHVHDTASCGFVFVCLEGLRGLLMEGWSCCGGQLAPS